MPDWTFSEDNREFFIHTPHTPRPWINYLTNGRYVALVSQTGGGFSFYLNPQVYWRTWPPGSAWKPA